MKKLNTYLTEKLKIGKSTKHQYAYQPTNYGELSTILEERLTKDKDADLNDIDVSKITDMLDLFKDLDPHNIDVSQWDVSNVKTMNGMFFNCRNLNCNLSDWDVSNVVTMFAMFEECKMFEGKGLENWEVSGVKNMRIMFWGCVKFNCDLNDWKINQKGSDLTDTFFGCKSLKNIPKWFE